MELILAPQAVEKLEEIERKLEEEIKKAIEVLKASPVTNNHTKYIDHPKHGRVYRYKVKNKNADHRILFNITDDGSEIHILAVMHRDKVYDVPPEEI